MAVDDLRGAHDTPERPGSSAASPLWFPATNAVVDGVHIKTKYLNLAEHKKPMDGYIDLRNSKELYERALARFAADAAISQHNRELVQRFLRDAALGKTVIGRAKKRIGPARLHGYIHHLTHAIGHLGKELDAITQPDMEAFIESLEAGRVRSRSPNIQGGAVGTRDTPLSDRYKVDVKITIKKFYKWLWGAGRTYPPLVEWIDTFCIPKDVQTLTAAEVERLVDRCATSQQRALVQLLFDGGFRVGELLNVRLKHVRRRESRGANDLSRTYFTLWVPHSKTYRRTVGLGLPASTKWLSIWLEEHPACPKSGTDGHLTAVDPEAPLFSVTYNAVRMLLRRMGQRALGKHVHPHLLRHSSATFWCNRLPYFKFCKRFGWSMTSKMPQRYIDVEGVDEIEAIEAYLRQGSGGSRGAQDPALNWTPI